MELVHLRKPPKDISVDDTFAIKEDNKIIGQAIIETKDMSGLFPDRPLRYCIKFNGDNSTVYALFSAAYTRAMSKAAEAKKSARIYTVLGTDQQEIIELLEPLCFENEDRLTRYRLDTSRIFNEYTKNPYPNITVLSDKIDKPHEAEYFLKRYNKLYTASKSHGWLTKLAGNKLFNRIVLVDKSGLVGEAVVYAYGNVGVLFYLYVVPRWRHKGIGKYLIYQAKRYFADNGIASCVADVWMSIPHLAALIEKSGFVSESVEQYYPGADLDFK